MISLLMNKYVIAAIAAALLIGSASWAYNSHVNGLVDAAVAANEAKWQVAAGKLHDEAEATLAAVVKANAEKERADSEHSKQLETAYVNHTTQLKTDLAAARAKYSSGLRDPGQRLGSIGCSAPSEGKADTAVPPDQIGGSRISPEFSQFLLGEAARADEVAAIANTCLAFIHPENS